MNALKSAKGAEMCKLISRDIEEQGSLLETKQLCSVQNGFGITERYEAQLRNQSFTSARFK
jgi:hypothetical protein